jgi:hypothetical protein
MITSNARNQFNKMRPETKDELRSRVKVFAASETHLISHFSRQEIMSIKSL